MFLWLRKNPYKEQRERIKQWLHSAIKKERRVDIIIFTIELNFTKEKPTF